MKHIPVLLIAAFSASAALAGTDAGVRQIQADTTSSRSAGIRFIKTEASPDVTTILEKDHPKEPSEVPVPHFAVKTDDNKFILTIGGKINPIVGVDIGNDLYYSMGKSPDFVGSQIPVPPQKHKKSDFFINPLNADISLQIVGFGGTENQITVYMRLGTNDADATITLKRAYLTWRGITAGKKISMFADANAGQPPTIDPQGPGGEVLTVVYEVSYTSRFYNGFRFAAGLSMPTFYSSSGRYYGEDFTTWNDIDIVGKPVCDPLACPQSIPDFPVWIEWAKSEWNRIRISGIARMFRYRDMLADKMEATAGWGAMVSGNLNPVDPLILYGQAVYGQGIGAYIQDLQGMPLSFVPSNNHPGKMKASPMMGLSFGATYNFSPKWQVNAMGSYARIWNVSPYAIRAVATDEDGEQIPGNINNFKHSVYAAANVFYNISSYLQVGLEYIYGRRTTYNAGGANDHRLQLQFKFTI